MDSTEVGTMKYILVARSCSLCGGDIAVKPFEEIPTEEEMRDLRNSLGGMFCIRTYLFENNDGDYGFISEA